LFRAIAHDHMSLAILSQSLDRHPPIEVI
jgi:hypothetical protein